MVSVVIPAFNEESTIARVVGAVIGHPLVDELIVVDDGSTDATAPCARDAGATVLTLPANRGKAAAMDAGVAQSRGDIILFLDADCEGFTHDHIDRIVTPVIEGRHAMYVGINSRRSFWLNRILHVFPILSGDRALRRELWDAVPPHHKHRFQIEIALNYFSRHYSPPAGFEILHGIRHIIKEKKHGLCVGFVRRLGMIGDILWITLQLYFVLAAREALMEWTRLLRRKG